MRMATPARWALALSTLVASSALTASALTAVAPPAQAAPPKDPATELAPMIGADEPTAVDGRYIVVLEEDTTARASAGAEETAEEEGGEVEHRLGSALEGFTAELPDEAVEALREDPDVAYIEVDQRVRALGTQSRAPWGLDRVDQRGRRLDGRYHYRANGRGVTAYVIDTGIRASHREFRGRVAKGVSIIRDGRGTADCNGHGTHVAGTLGGRKYGVAKRVTLRPVRVLRCGGWGRTSQVVAGIDWVTRHHKNGPAVANLSIGSGPSRAMDNAVQRAFDDGIAFVVAAGNEGGDACDVSPSSAPAAISVAATRRNDARSAFSSYGKCVDVFAPGTAITSAWYRSNKDIATISGTSMASPHVAGAAALYLQRHPDATPQQVTTVLLDRAVTGKVRGRRGSPDRLLQTDITSVPPPKDVAGDPVG